MAKVVLDAVGGDHAPVEVLKGVALALEKGHCDATHLILTGPKDQVLEQAAAHKVPTGPGGIEVVDAPDVLTCAVMPSGTPNGSPAMRGALPSNSWTPHAS